MADPGSVVEIHSAKGSAFTLGLKESYRELSFSCSLSLSIFSTPFFLNISRRPETRTAGAPVPAAILLKYPCGSCGATTSLRRSDGGGICGQCNASRTEVDRDSLDFFPKELKAFTAKPYSETFLDLLLPRMELAHADTGHDPLSTSMLARATLILLGHHIHKTLSLAQGFNLTPGGGEEFDASWARVVATLVTAGSERGLLALAQATANS